MKIYKRFVVQNSVCGSFFGNYTVTPLVKIRLVIVFTCGRNENCKHLTNSWSWSICSRIRILIIVFYRWLEFAPHLFTSLLGVCFGMRDIVRHEDSYRCILMAVNSISLLVRACTWLLQLGHYAVREYSPITLGLLSFFITSAGRSVHFLIVHEFLGSLSLKSSQTHQNSSKHNFIFKKSVGLFSYFSSRTHQ